MQDAAFESKGWIMRKIIKTAVVGMGARGEYFAEMYGNAAHGFRLRAVCDYSAPVLDRIRRKYGEAVACYRNLDAMLQDPEIEAVLITTNDPDHAAPAIAALRAGKHVLVEKPLCQTLADARRIAATVRQARSVFMVGFELRCCTLFERIKALLDEGRIGRVILGHVFDNVSVGGNYYFHDPRKQQAFYRSLLLQKASHSLDLLNWFMGRPPVKVYGTGGLVFYGRKYAAGRRCRDCPARRCPYRLEAMGLQLDYNVKVEMPDVCVWSKAMNLNDHSVLSISYAGGGQATFHECHFTPDYSREFWLVGDKGKLYGYYDNPGRFLIRIEYAHAQDRRVEEWKPVPDGSSHGGGDVGLCRRFHERIARRDCRGNRAAMEQGYYSTALAVCAEQSMAGGRPVGIPGLTHKSGGAAG